MGASGNSRIVWVRSDRHRGSDGYIFEAGDEGLGNFRHTVEIIHSRSQLYRDEMKINSITTKAKTHAPAVQTPDILAYVATHHRIDPTDETGRAEYL